MGKKTKMQKTKRARMEDARSLKEEASGSREEIRATLALQRAEALAPEAMVSHVANAFNPPNCQGGEVSPQAAEPAPDVNQITLNLRPDPKPVVRVATGPTEEFSLHMSISYLGELLCEHLLPEGEFLITSAQALPNGPVNCLKRFILPPPDKIADAPKQKIVQRLLDDLVKGIMVASNHEGIFIQCRGKVCVSWSGFLAPEGQIKLENDTLQQLFKPREFRSALEQHRQGLAPFPDPRVILYVGNEAGKNGHVDSQPIVIQMEQTFAIRLRSSDYSL
ncbi:PREDICTED: interferon regulatory factor 9-like [Thamnophis sirtalis]|uniref:Interferon regulatory factor 9-like n=1 Tax=Thamnophis sirtalis TaxID=35019 RepID=A0A6I9XJ32_9SAUR|nr:PREDICTED: interferon regulatory factor 9-like [Thamnophis sirtalis]